MYILLNQPGQDNSPIQEEKILSYPPGHYSLCLSPPSTPFPPRQLSQPLIPLCFLFSAHTNLGAAQIILTRYKQCSIGFECTINRSLRKSSKLKQQQQSGLVMWRSYSKQQHDILKLKRNSSTKTNNRDNLGLVMWRSILVQ